MFSLFLFDVAPLEADRLDPLPLPAAEVFDCLVFSLGTKLPVVIQKGLYFGKLKLKVYTVLKLYTYVGQTAI